MIRHFSAGGIVFKKEHGKVLFLLRKSSERPGYYAGGQWSLPKGWLDDAGEGIPGPKALGQKKASTDEIKATALREVHEEAGVEAKIVSRLENVQYFYVDENKEKIFKTIMYFLMEYDHDLPEGFGDETSEVAWVTLSEARERLKKLKNESDLLARAGELIACQVN